MILIFRCPFENMENGFAITRGTMEKMDEIRTANSDSHLHRSDDPGVGDAAGDGG